MNSTITVCTHEYNRLYYEYMRIQTLNWIKCLILVETISQAEESELMCDLP